MTSFEGMIFSHPISGNLYWFVVLNNVKTSPEGSLCVDVPPPSEKINFF